MVSGVLRFSHKMEFNIYISAASCQNKRHHHVVVVVVCSVKDASLFLLSSPQFQKRNENKKKPNRSLDASLSFQSKVAARETKEGPVVFVCVQALLLFSFSKRKHFTCNDNRDFSKTNGVDRVLFFYCSLIDGCLRRFCRF